MVSGFSSSNPANWFVVKPHGGLNDVLCQIEKAWDFAERTERSLLIDTTQSGLMVDFFQIFKLRDPRSSRIEIVGPTPTLLEYLKSKSTYPPAYSGSLEKSLKSINPNQSFTFDFAADRDAEVIVHESEGGGIDSRRLLQRVEFLAEVSNVLCEALSRMPSNYVSAHIRFSDLTSDYTNVFNKLQNKHPGEYVFVATDSSKVIQAAKDFFGSRLIKNDGIEHVEFEGPLHLDNLPRHSQRIERLIHVLVDLIIISSGSHLYFGNVRELMGISGFSRLAAHLAGSPNLRMQLLGGLLEQGRCVRCQVVHVGTLVERSWEKIRWCLR